MENVCFFTPFPPKIGQISASTIYEPTLYHDSRFLQNRQARSPKIHGGNPAMLQCQKSNSVFVHFADFFILFSSANLLKHWISCCFISYTIIFILLSYRENRSNILSHHPIISFKIHFAFQLDIYITAIFNIIFYTRYPTVSSVINSNRKDIVYDIKNIK